MASTKKLRNDLDGYSKPECFPLQDGPCNPPKKRKSKKTWLVERRYIGPERRSIFVFSKYFSRDWHSYRRYVTRSAAQKAVNDLSKPDRWTATENFEYRVVQPETED